MKLFKQLQKGQTTKSLLTPLIVGGPARALTHSFFTDYPTVTKLSRTLRVPTKSVSSDTLFKVKVG